MSDKFCYTLPAVRGLQAGRRFYMASTPFSVLPNLFRLDTGDGSAMSRSQRDVNHTRAKKVAKYITDNPETFVLPALTGVISGGEVNFIESKDNSNVGILEIPMEASLLFVDGQHRATGICHSLEGNVELRHHQVPLMLFDDMSLEERQMAFSDINSNVSKPAQALSDTYNHRDDLAELARTVATTVPEFVDYVDFERNVVGANSAYLFSLKTIKETSARLLGIKKTDSVNDEQRDLVIKFWDLWFKGVRFDFHFQSFDDTVQFRTRNIMTAGVMLHAASMAGNIAISNAGSIDKVPFNKLFDICWLRNSADFANRCVNPELRTMKSDSTAVKLTSNFFLMKMGIPLDPEAANLEKKVFGSYDRPVPPKPPVPSVSNLNDFKVELCEFGLSVLKHNSELGLSIEQIAEAGEKMSCVFSSNEEVAASKLLRENETADTEDFKKVREDNNRAVRKAYNGLLEGEFPDVETAKILMNLRTLRAFVRDAIK